MTAPSPDRAVDEDGAVRPLQARPETVGADRRPALDWREPNPMNFPSDEDTTWTTTNAAEGIPGVQTPLGVSLVGPGAESAFRGAFHASGALSTRETAAPDRPEDRIVSFFFGRCAANLSALVAFADRIPGTSGAVMGEQIFSHVPVNYHRRVTRRYYPRVLAKMAIPFVVYPRRVRRNRATTQAFWLDAQRQLVDADEATARHFVIAGRAALIESLRDHTTLVMGAVQPSFDLLDKLASSVGVSAQTLMSGHGGHEESAVLDDVWSCSQGDLTLDEFLLRHGHHGPNEGDVAATVWREDPEPVRKLMASYRRKGVAPNSADLSRGRLRAEADFLSRLSPVKRLVGRLEMKMAARYLPMRGVGKVAFVQCIDVTRAAARRLGVHLVAAGDIAEVDDIFFFTIDEIAAGLPDDARGLVATRRALYDHYRTLELPANWLGRPEPVTVDFDASVEMITGTGASPGVVEGIARVVEDPAAADIEEGEILVASCTDPSWASLMFLSAGLIADVGGVMSHTAVVARELSIPCVVNTKVAMQVIKDGDRVRMDGTTGHIQIIGRVGPTSATSAEGRTPSDRS